MASRIIEVLKDASGTMSPKEIKEALEAKGYKHAYKPIMENLGYLKSKMIVNRWIDDKWFILSLDNKRAYTQTIFQLILDKHHILTEDEQDELWLRLVVGLDDPLGWMEARLRTRGETMGVNLDSDSEEMRLRNRNRSRAMLFDAIEEAKSIMEEHEARASFATKAMKKT